MELRPAHDRLLLPFLKIWADPVFFEVILCVRAKEPAPFPSSLQWQSILRWSLVLIEYPLNQNQPKLGRVVLDPASTFSRHGSVQASLALLIWLIQKVLSAIETQSAS